MTFSTASITALLLTLNGLNAALIMTQEKSLFVNLGNNVKISCAQSGSSSRYTMSWYQQKSGGVPKFLLTTSNTRASGVPSRFTSTSSSSDQTQYLLINGVQADDAATYYCACASCGTDHSVAIQCRAHTKTQPQPPSPPSLDLMAPAQPPLPGASATLLCLAKGYHPDGAAMSWSEDGGSVTGTEVQTGQSQRQTDGTYTVSSLLTLPSTRWHSGHTFTCHLSHSALSSPLSKSVTSRQCSP
ncbi:immunoglobulin lambda-1 light chain-like [Polymixia lowei]